MTPGETTTGRAVAAALDAVAIAASAMVVLLMVYLVIARYVLHQSIVGLHELILLFTLQLYMVGALIAARRRTQVTVDWLAMRFAGSRHGRWHEAVIALATLAAAVFFVVWTYRMLAWGIERPQKTPALGLPLWISQAAILVCALGCTGFAVRDLWQSVAGLRRKS